MAPFVNNLTKRQDTEITHQSLHLETSPDSPLWGRRDTKATQEDTVTFQTGGGQEVQAPVKVGFQK